MLKSHIKTSARIILRNKTISLIGITGLAVGFIASMIMIGYVFFELSYDRSHENAENIYRIQHDRYADGELQYQKAQSFFPLGEVMTLEYPEVLDYTTLFKISDQTSIIIAHLSNEAEEVRFTESDVYHVKGNFLNFFPIHLVQGSKELTTLSKGEVLISQSIAQKYFGDQPAINKVLNHNYYGDYKVVGVFADTPSNSHINFNFLFSWESLEGDNIGGETYNWDWDAFYNYILLNNGTDIQFLESKFPELVTKYMADRRRTARFNPVFSLQPLTSIHLHSHLQGEASENGNIQLVYILSGLGLLIMFIAWANYINLSTARALNRSIEAGIRKTIGSTKGELIKQFLVESLMVNLCAVLLAFGFILIKSSLHFELDLLNQSPSSMLTVGFFIFVVVGAIISGLYPALILSSFKPSAVLKGNGKGAAINTIPNLRKLMVVTQFTISIALVIASVAIFKQTNFMQEKGLGMNIDQILVVKTSASFGPPGLDSLFVQKLELLGNKLSSYPDIKGTAASYDIPGKVYKSVLPSFRNFNKSSESLHLYFSRIDHHFINLFETNLVAGRNFSDMSSYNTVINMEALTTFGFSTPEEAIGERITYGSSSDAVEGLEIIGVVDFRATSYKEHNYPIVFQTYWGPMQYLSIKIAPEKYSNLEENIRLIGETWELIFPDIPFDYFFLNDSFNSQYRSELQFSSALNLLTALAIFVACLGLYGLSIFVVETRTREIGIRKVMGASIQQLVILLVRNVVLLILVASVIALPLIWYLLDMWLENYPFRVKISLWVFIIPILGVMVIALLTVSRGVLKTAFTNPVDSLRQP